MYKPMDERVICRITKRYIKDTKGKPVLADDGAPIYEPQQAALVISSNVEGIKKGMTIIPVLRGGIPINSEDKKDSFTVILDRQDIYAIKI
jgi:hypothetical protein